MQKFYIVLNEEQQGPLTIEEIKKKNIQRDTLIWNENYEDWFEIQNLNEFKSFFQKTPPPIPKKVSKEPIQVVIAKEEKNRKKKKIDYSKIFESLFKLSFISLIIAIGFFLLSAFLIYDANKFDNYDYSKVTLGERVSFNLPIDDYSPPLTPSRECDFDGNFECLKYNIEKRKEKIFEMSFANSLYAFGISYLVIILIYFSSQSAKEEEE